MYIVIVYYSPIDHDLDQRAQLEGFKVVETHNRFPGGRINVLCTVVPDLCLFLSCSIIDYVPEWLPESFSL